MIQFSLFTFQDITLFVDCPSNTCRAVTDAFLQFITNIYTYNVYSSCVFVGGGGILINSVIGS